MNLARLPDAGARKALAMAVDRERITRQVTGAGERPAFGWVPDGIPGYAPARFEWQDLPYPEAATRARELWQTASAAGKAPTKIKLCTDASANHHRTAVALADLWRTALGVETEIVELEWNVYLDTRHNPGDCDLVRLGWSADFVDPEAFADVFESGNPQNTLGYSQRGLRRPAREIAHRDRQREAHGAACPRRATTALRRAGHTGLLPCFEASRETLRRGLPGESAGPRRVARPATQ